jgi:catalase
VSASFQPLRSGGRCCSSRVAYAHYKFLGFTEPAAKLFKKIGLPEDPDDGFIALNQPGDMASFITTCRALRFWDRPDGA